MPLMPHTAPDMRETHGDATPAGAFRRGMAAGLPIFLGYVPVGAAFGVLARGVGFTVWQAVLCSATALAGAGQFIALSLLSGGATIAATLSATAVVNLRYLLFSTTVAPLVRRARTPLRTWLAFTLTDETFAVNLGERRRGGGSPVSMAAVGLVAWAGWVSGTAAGALGAGLIADPSKWGVGFAMPAMFSALFVALAEDRRHVVTGAGAALVVLALPASSALGVEIGREWHVVIAAIAAATVASAMPRRTGSAR